MEEKKEQEKQGKKLSYEQLEAYANQTVVRAQKMAEDYDKLAEAYKQVITDRSIAEMNLAFKCIEHRVCFSKEFIDSIVKRIEESLSPVEAENKEA